jgi:YHS domain-containing protein
MIRKTWLSVLTGVVFVFATVAFAGAGEKKSGKASGEMMNGCGEHHSAAMKAKDQANVHLAEAKGATTLTEMRRHVELAQSSMAEMEKQMSTCMETMHKMHGGMEGHHKGMTGSAMSGKSSGATAAAKAVDPVCHMEVDPANAPKATYNGKTYYFCSEAEKEQFEKNPGAYVKTS